MTSSPPSRRAHLRALLLAGALACHGLAVVPSPKKVSPAQFRHPVAVEELARWVEVLGGLGVETTAADLVDLLVPQGGDVVALRTALLNPAQPVFKATGTGQGWGLFAYPDSYPDRLRVEGRTASGRWVPLYVALDPEHDFMAPQLAYRRVRGIYDGHSERPGKPYDNLTAWVGGRALDAHPDLAVVQVRFVRSHTLPPTETQDPKTTSRLKRVIRREGAE